MSHHPKDIKGETDVLFSGGFLIRKCCGLLVVVGRLTRNL